MPGEFDWLEKLSIEELMEIVPAVGGLGPERAWQGSIKGSRKERCSNGVARACSRRVSQPR